MKGKILAGIVLWCIGAIYTFLIYPLLQNTPDVNSNLPAGQASDVKSIGDIEPNNSYTSPLPIVSGSSKWQKNNTICFQENCFSIEIADTFASRQQGLMNREYLPQDAGMLFVFDVPGSYWFWMKNTLIPLDIIWMDEDFVVVDTATMTPCQADPCPIYNHSWQALYALEINAGLVEEYDVVPGSQFMKY